MGTSAATGTSAGMGTSAAVGHVTRETLATSKLDPKHHTQCVIFRITVCVRGEQRLWAALLSRRCWGIWGNLVAPLSATCGTVLGWVWRREGSWDLRTDWVKSRMCDNQRNQASPPRRGVGNGSLGTSFPAREWKTLAGYLYYGGLEKGAALTHLISIKKALATL